MKTTMLPMLRPLEPPDAQPLSAYGSEGFCQDLHTDPIFP